ncbi:PepSY domain-containing protein [Marinobacter sp. JSM 1782161]|uniref:PepSY domain-containing protein n=1 Tax=Marinobacter sp. JSM 1782161 TaxID=2685906 RepID=UPI001D187522|nr:PepSY domain-containing protein [Marinobacter sp. JSM 1782161]
MTKQLMLMMAVPLLVLGWAAGLHADDDEWRRLHREVEAGRVQPLQSVLDHLEERYRGQVVEVEFERDDGESIYEIEMLGPDGQIVEFEVDAATGEVIGIEGRGIESMERR